MTKVDMIPYSTIHQFILTWTIFLFVLQSCGSTKMAPYDDDSYQKTVEIKVRASALMDHATEPYEIHSDTVEELFMEIEGIKRYELSRASNDITYKMWQLLTDEDRFLLAGFLKRWKENEQLSGVFVDAAKPQVIEAFDLLIQFESNKDTKARSNLEDFILKNQ